MPKKRAALEKGLRGKLLDLKFESTQKKGAYRQLLQSKLGKKYDEVTKSYDIIGNVALIDATGDAGRKMGRAIIQTNRGVETILSKGSAVKGKYRIRKYIHILGKKNFVARYKENGVELEFDIRKTFFSSRLAFDRLRIAKLVKPKESVIVMFAGMGPFAIEIGKMQKESQVIGIELNRDAFRYMKSNIKLNRLSNVIAEQGDVKKIAKKHKGVADRIVMPLPNSAYDFLDSVIEVSKKRCIVHYYAFGDKETAFEDQIKKVKGFFGKHNVKVKILDKRVVRQYSPQEIEIVLDMLITK